MADTLSPAVKADIKKIVGDEVNRAVGAIWTDEASDLKDSAVLKAIYDEVVHALDESGRSRQDRFVRILSDNTERLERIEKALEALVPKA